MAPDMTSTSTSFPNQRKFKRVLLKLSGEALREPGAMDNISLAILEDTARQIKDAVASGVQIGVVVGGGNFWRGVTSQCSLIDRASADQIGMLATMMNSLALQAALESMGVASRVLSAAEMNTVGDPMNRKAAIRLLEAGEVVIFGGGTGNPFFSTDSGAALRAAEIGADVVFKATKVDGVYNKDPKKFPDAVKYERITFQEALDQRLGVMDATAFNLCIDSGVAIVVFDMTEPGNITKALVGEPLGTLVERQ
jgi:uridylate kinase